MCRRTFSLFWLLTAGIVLATGGARAQDATPPPDPIYPFPLYHDRPETGGLFLTGGYAMFRQTNPLKGQVIARRGFFDTDGSQAGGIVGQFIGSGTPALRADDAGGPSTYQPGFRVSGGWRFEGGLTVEVSWLQLLKANYHSVASLVPRNFAAGQDLADSFVTAPVFNFPPEYSGPEVKAPALGTPLLTVNQGYGIWNAADVMSIDFIQRYQQFDVTGRIPIYETDCCRSYGLVGFRFAWIWERFRWRTVDSGFFTDVPLDPTVAIDPITGRIFRTLPLTITTTLHPDQSPSNAAIYTNVVSNRMYGPTIGCGNEWYLGHGFAVGCDLGAALFMDVVKERAKYELGDKEMPPQSKRAITQYKIVPELTAAFKVYWYPIEGVQVQVGWDMMAFFNTVAAPEPVSFNYGGLDPDWKSTFRWFDGFQAGIGLIF
jgi:hypothetical protein